MPECPKPPIDVKVDKENTPSGGQGNGFNIWVTNVGAPITFGPGELTVKDVIPPGLTINSMTSPNWTCIPIPATGPGTITCTYNLAGSLGTGAQLPDSIVFGGFLTIKDQPLKNCAIVSIAANVGVDTNPSNDQACVTVNTLDTGSVIVEKKVQNNTKGDLSNWTYPVIVTCGGTSTTYNLPDGGTQTVNNLPLGTSCHANENTLPVPANACPDNGTTPVWLTSITPSVTIGSTPSTITVQNTLDCETGGELIVEKKVINNTSGDLTGWTYPMDVDCAGGVIGSPSLPDGGSQTFSNIAQGTICSVNENTVAVPANACTGNTVPVWSATNPAAMIGPLPKTITVQNTLDCTPTPGELTVVKQVVNNTGGPIPVVTFPVTVTCGYPPQPWPLTLTDNVPQTVTGLVIPSICQVQEVLPPAPAGVCPAGFTAAWSIPVYSATSVAITTTPTTVTVQNTLNCVQIATVGNLVVHKTFVNQTGHAMPSSGLTFPVTVACGPPANLNPSFILAPNGSHTVNNIAYGSICTVTEAMPIPVPAGVCGPGEAFYWYLPLYTPNGQTVISGSTTTIDILNEAYCIAVSPMPPPPVCPAGAVPAGNGCVKLPIVCTAPMVQGPAGQCICGPGTVLVGKECVRPPLECRPPLVPNAAGTDCVCPHGTEPKGRECVRQIECRAPLIPNAAGTDCVCPHGTEQKGRGNA